MIKKEKNYLKLLVFGIDGATFNVISPLISAGKLPNLKNLREEGTWSELSSTIPPVSACAWSSFMTGRGPGKHGIFHWRTYNPYKYTSQNTKLLSNNDLIGTTFWDILGENGYKIGVITVPVTYPVWKINGIMIAGYPCPDKRLNYTYPEDYAKKLKKSYNFQVDYYVKAPDEEIVKNGLDMMEDRTSAAIKMIEENRLDACVLVLGEVDRVQHDFWKYRDSSFQAYHDPKGKKFRQVIEEHYETADKQLGRLLKLCDKETMIVVMSDHGGGPHPPKYFFTNSWLLENGYFKLKENLVTRRGFSKKAINKLRNLFPFEERLKRILPDKIVDKARSINMELSAVDWEKTSAYRFPMYHPAEGIEINLKGRQPRGTVNSLSEYNKLRELIKRELLEAKDPVTGGKVVDKAYFKEDIYKGRFLEIAPDIVFLTRPDYITSERICAGKYVEEVDLDSLIKYNGVHTMDGIFIASSNNIIKDKKIKNAAIVDIAPTIQYALRVPISTDMDGKILFDIFKESFKKQNRPQYFEKSITKGVKRITISRKEEKEMEDKLKGLGYID